MKSTRLTSAFYLLISILILLASSGCDEIGVFATIAVSDVIEEGLLPEGTSPSKVVHVDDAANNLDDYDFFSSGPTLWYRNITDRSDVTVSTRWQSIELVDINGTEWDAVQSIAGSLDRIVVTLARESGSFDIQVGLFYFTQFNSSNRVNLTPVANARWTSTGSSYNVARVFDPDPADPTVYLNLQYHKGKFGDNGTVFDRSEMYIFDPTTVVDVNAELQAGDWATNLSNRMVTGAAYNGANYVFTISRFLELSTGDGMLVNNTGFDITPPEIDVPVTGVTWLPYAGAFVLGAQSLTTAGGTLSSSVYAVFGSATGLAGDWDPITGSSDRFRVRSFVDVSDTAAGLDTTQALVLAGTASFAAASSDNDGAGYVEIVTNNDPAPANWSIVSTDSSYNFALANNYSVSDLRTASIDGFFISSAPMANYVYASARSLGIWRINANAASPSWARE